MHNLIIASTRKNSGKTSIIVGLAAGLKKSFGYMKPFGDRLHYRKKQSWDYDSALILKTYGLDENQENITIEFDHTNVRYIYDSETIQDKLLKITTEAGKSSDIMFVEGGKDLAYGASVHLDILSVTRCLKGRLIIVISGDDDSIVDDATFVKTYVDLKGIDFCGVILNKVQDVEDFKEVYLDIITDMGINVVGIIPYREELTRLSVDYISEQLFARVIAGESHLGNAVINVFIGDMSAENLVISPRFEIPGRLLITSGDRKDIIQLFLEKGAAGIILTNNIEPDQSIVSMAAKHNIPLLLVPFDTHETVRQVDTIEPLISKTDSSKIALWKQLVEEHVNLSQIADL